MTKEVRMREEKHPVVEAAVSAALADSAGDTPATTAHLSIRISFVIRASPRISDVKGE
jgi:hypothetical protein